MIDLKNAGNVKSNKPVKNGFVFGFNLSFLRDGLWYTKIKGEVGSLKEGMD